MDTVVDAALTSNRLAEKKMLDKKLLNTIIETEEKERLYFAQELHDGVGPLLFAVKMYLELMTDKNADIPQDEIRKNALGFVDDAILTLQELSLKFSPLILRRFGLTEAVKIFVDKLKVIRNTDISFTSNVNERFEETKETVLYRVICECINNTLKYASASKIKIGIFKAGDELKINYSDNGVGFNLPSMLAEKKGNGLYNLQSRIQSICGELILESKPEKGINVNITIPI